MKKFIPLLLIGALISLIQCRQADEFESNKNSVLLNDNSVSKKIITKSESDSVNIITFEETDKRDRQDW